MKIKPSSELNNMRGMTDERLRFIYQGSLLKTKEGLPTPVTEFILDLCRKEIKSRCREATYYE